MSSDNDDDNTWVFKVKDLAEGKKKSSSSSKKSSKSSKVKSRVKDKSRVETFKERDILKKTMGNSPKAALEEAQIGRKTRATYLDERFEAKDYEIPEISQRLISISVDLGILAIVFGISNFERMIILSEDLYFSIANPIGMAEALSNEQLDTILPVFNFLLLGFIFHILPSILMKKSIGKMAMKLKVYSDETIVPTGGKMFSREVFYKPLSLLTLFGFAKIFFSDDAQGLHDSICHTIVVKDNK